MDLNELRPRFKEQKTQTQDNKQYNNSNIVFLIYCLHIHIIQMFLSHVLQIPKYKPLERG